MHCCESDVWELSAERHIKSVLAHGQELHRGFAILCVAGHLRHHLQVCLQGRARSESNVRALNAQPAVEQSRLAPRFAGHSLCRVTDTGSRDLSHALLQCWYDMRRGTHMLARGQGEVAGSCYYVYAMREISQAPHAFLKRR